MGERIGMNPGVTRPAAVAGTFYPGRRDELAKTVDELLSAVPPAGKAPPPKALIVPHAGYIYSGSVAAHAYARLRGARRRIERVVLIGPAHRVFVYGIAGPGCDAFETPLGLVAVDRATLDAVRATNGVRENAAAHAHEHALEVQLPFLQAMLDRYAIVPLVVGNASADAVAAVLDAVWGGDETLILVSSDLSHYRRYDEACAIDAGTVRAIAQGDRDIDTEEACGATPINGLMRCARARGLSSELLDLRNSGDTAGDRSRVVGYAAFAFA